MTRWTSGQKPSSATLGLLGTIDSLANHREEIFGSKPARRFQAEADNKQLVDVEGRWPVANQILRVDGEPGRGKLPKRAPGEAKAPGRGPNWARANRLSFVLAIIMMLSLIGSVIFTFVGVSHGP